MSKFLSSIASDPSTIIVVVSFIVLSILLLYVVTAIIGKPFDVALGPIKLQFGSKGSVEKQKDTYKLMIEKAKDITKEKYSEIFELKYETIRRQVNYMDERLLDIHSGMCDLYIELLRSKLPEDERSFAYSHDQYRTYQMMLRVALKESLTNNIKKAFRQNHLAEKDVDEWDKYTSQKIETALTHLTNFLDLMYDQKNLVSRLELSLENDKYRDTFSKKLKDCFNTARDISIKNKKREEDLYSELTTELSNILT